MPSAYYKLERRRERLRDLRAMLALAIWGGGGALLWLAWDTRLRVPEPYHDVVGTAVYVATFFYIFAIWPILTGVERLFGSLQHQDGGSATRNASSSSVTSRAVAGGDSSPATGS
jgi:hypothetical protein